MVNQAVYEKRIVAFVDILGFSTMIEDSKTDIKLRRKIKKAVELIRESARTNADYSVRKVSTFSDSAVISYGLKTSSLFYILIDIIHLQLGLGALGIMIRGGISIGDCYHDGNIIFGPAMNEAYRLEHEVAKWPRVVIMEETLRQGLMETIERNPYGIGYDLEEIKGLLKEDDYNEEADNPDLFFVDFLRQSDELIDFGDEYYNWLRDFRVSLIAGLNRYSPKNEDLEISKADADRIFKKYRCLLGYWNSVVEDESANLPVPAIDSENQMKFRENYKKLGIKKLFPYY